MVEMVIPMENLDDPMPIRFTFKVSNIDDIPIYVKSEIQGAPANWNLGGAELHGALAVGEDDYFLNDNNTRDKPADGASDAITLRVTYYSDVGYSVVLTFEDITYNITYVDFTDVRYNVVDDDTFEINLEGWTKVEEVGIIVLDRSTLQSRTGVASMRMWSLDPGDVAYATKDFTIAGGGVAEAYIRIWVTFVLDDNTEELIFELITDAGGGSERVLPIAMDYNPKGGATMEDQWLCIGAELPVNGVYEVRLRIKCELMHTVNTRIFIDDIRVVEV